jgi:hypothetical protein
MYGFYYGCGITADAYYLVPFFGEYVKQIFFKKTTAKKETINFVPVRLVFQIITGTAAYK